MKSIYKYSVALVDNQVVSLPKDAVVLNVITQDNRPVLYALVDTSEDAPKEDLKVRVIGTGHPTEEDLLDNHTYLSTFKLNGGALVFHVFIGR